MFESAQNNNQTSSIPRHGGNPETILTVVALVSLFSALIQISFGAIGGGHLIKFIPYQVVSGYLSGVGLLIGISQLPKLLGLQKDMGLWSGIKNPSIWNLPGLAVGLVSMFGMVVAPKISKKIPPPIFALGSGVAAYFAIAFFHRDLLSLESNSLIIGSLKVNGSFLESISIQLSMLTQVDWVTVKHALIPALTLSTLLSIDTLKTCVAIDSMTRSRHNSNREIVGQGIGNLICALVGGMPGAGTMGATLVNVSSDNLLNEVVNFFLAVCRLSFMKNMTLKAIYLTWDW